MRRVRSMLAVLGIVCALSGITGCSNRNGNTSATNGSESNMQNGSNGIQTESNMQNGSSGTQAESNMQNGSSGTQAESNTQKNNSTKKNRNQSQARTPLRPICIGQIYGHSAVVSVVTADSVDYGCRSKCSICSIANRICKAANGIRWLAIWYTRLGAGAFAGWNVSGFNLGHCSHAAAYGDFLSPVHPAGGFWLSAPCGVSSG